MKNIKQYYKFKENNKIGFKDLNNKIIIDFQYEDATNFIENFVWLKKENNWTFFDIKEEKIIINSDNVFFFNKEISIISIKDNFYILENQTASKQKIPYDVVDVQNEMFIKVTKNCYYNFLSFDLKPIFKEWYQDIDYIEYGYFYIKDNSGKTIINIKEERVFNKYFDDINVNSKDFFKVKIDGKWMFIDKLGGEYDLYKLYKYDFGEFKNFHLSFKAKNKSGFLNQFFEVKFKKKFILCSDVINGYVIVKKYNRFGVVNMKGKYVIKPIYSFISYDEQNIFYAERKKHSTYVTTSGVELFKIN